jgi:GrpB-like predicted nucleotidyltransferase (UPF0157 family)
MRCHTEVGAEYAELKRGLAKQYATDPLGYTEAKSGFIWRTMQVADLWAQEIGWNPGASDA